MIHFSYDEKKMDIEGSVDDILAEIGIAFIEAMRTIPISKKRGIALINGFYKQTMAFYLLEETKKEDMKNAGDFHISIHYDFNE